jgi:hypothetical protein
LGWKLKGNGKNFLHRMVVNGDKLFGKIEIKNDFQGDKTVLETL